MKMFDCGCVCVCVSLPYFLLSIIFFSSFFENIQTHIHRMPPNVCVWLWNLSSFYIFRKSQIKYIQVKWVCLLPKKKFQSHSKKKNFLLPFSYLRSLIIKRGLKNYVSHCKITFCASKIAFNSWLLVLVNSRIYFFLFLSSFHISSKEKIYFSFLFISSNKINNKGIYTYKK